MLDGLQPYDNLLVDLSPGMPIGGPILLWPARGTTSRSRLFMVPEGENLVGFGILPAIPPKYWEQVRPMLDNASRLCVAMGAKRYLSATWTSPRMSGASTMAPVGTGTPAASRDGIPIRC